MSLAAQDIGAGAEEGAGEVKEVGEEVFADVAVEEAGEGEEEEEEGEGVEEAEAWEGAEECAGGEELSAGAAGEEEPGAACATGADFFSPYSCSSVYVSAITFISVVERAA